MDTFALIQQHVQADRRTEAKALCQEFIAHNPGNELGLMQLLVLDPTPLEEIAVLEALLQHYPHHRYASRFEERLDEMRIVALLSEGGSSGEEDNATALAARGKQRLGEFLVEHGVITPKQLAQVIAEQQQYPRGEAPRLGTLLVLRRILTSEQLAAALIQQGSSGFGEFGEYLLRRNVITAAQLQQALARQAHVMVDAERRRQDAQGNGLRSWFRKPTTQLTSIPKLGEVLVELGILTPELLEQLLEERERTYKALMFN